MEGRLNFGANIIPYKVIFSDRKTLGIKVYPTGNVEVLAPIGTQSDVIDVKLQKRLRWIWRQLQFFSELGPAMPEKRYISGESHYYLGRQFLLRVEDGDYNSVKYKGRYFQVTCTSKNKVKDLLRQWYKVHANEKFLEYAQPIIEKFAKYEVRPSSVCILEMKNRWGSCTPNGKIILNTRLIMAPRPCIEYVITHELCHLVHPNHTKAFWELLQKEMPDWERWKNKLERFMM